MICHHKDILVNVMWWVSQKYPNNEISYLSPILNLGFLGALAAPLTLRASPSFSVTIHSFTRLASSRPIIVAFVRCRDMPFSKRIQNTSKWSDLNMGNTWTKVNREVEIWQKEERKKLKEIKTTLEFQLHWRVWWVMEYIQLPTLGQQPQALKLWQVIQCNRTQMCWYELWPS